MNRRSVITLSTAALFFLGAFGNARADETLKFRQITHATSAQTQDVGDVDGHTWTVYRFSGIASFPDGTVGTVYFVGARLYKRLWHLFGIQQPHP
jgi:hypothetical protein